MFQNKNNQTADGGQTILNQEHDLPIEDLPVHTMKKDLEAIKNPELAKAEIKYQEAATRLQPTSLEGLTEAQKTSPFLGLTPSQKSSPKDAKPAISDSRIKIIEPAFQPEKSIYNRKPPTLSPEKSIFASEKKLPESEQRPHHIDFGKVFAGVITILIIAIIAAGGYYFWTTRQNIPEVVVTPPITEPEPEPVVAKFSTDKPNILIVDMSAATGATIKELLKNTAQDVADEKITAPAEFIVTGIDRKPVPFKDFAKISGITFSPALAANLSDAFSLFVYNDNALTRLGLAIDSSDPIKLKNLIASEERTLAKNISPIFLAPDYTLTAKAYASSNYNSLAIRYVNIISPEDLSVDYTISQNKLIIGTTKMTLRSVMDYLQPQAE